jgi:hypothetical protein
MKLRPTEFCPIHRSVFAVVGSKFAKNVGYGWVFNALKPRTIPRGYRELRSPTEMRKLLNRKIVEQHRICAICCEEFTDYSDICQTTGIPKEWEERGETTIRTISKQHTGGAMEKRAQPDG